MQYSSPKEYLKKLKIQRNYVNKFIYGTSHNSNLTAIGVAYLHYLDKEIKDIEDFITLQIIKKRNQQIDIYSFIDKE